MPKLKRQASPYDKLLVLVNGYLKLNDKRLEDVLDCSYSTAQKRIKSPQNFTLGEIRHITRTLDIPIEEVRAALPY